MAIFETVCEGASPVDKAIQDQLLEPFIEATRTVLREMAGTELVIRAVYQKILPLSPLPDTPQAGPSGKDEADDISAVVGLRSATEDSLVLSFPWETAAALTGRVLAGVLEKVDKGMVEDCVGEIANVVAGQAKALLADTPYRFAFSLPKVVVGAMESRTQQALKCLGVAFASNQGGFALQLFLKP